MPHVFITTTVFCRNWAKSFCIERTASVILYYLFAELGFRSRSKTPNLRSRNVQSEPSKEIWVKKKLKGRVRDVLVGLRWASAITPTRFRNLPQNRGTIQSPVRLCTMLTVGQGWANTVAPAGALCTFAPTGELCTQHCGAGLDWSRAAVISVSYQVCLEAIIALHNVGKNIIYLGSQKLDNNCLRCKLTLLG